MIAKILKPLFIGFIKVTLFLQELYHTTLIEIMTDMAKTERDAIVAAREAAYQERKAKYREEQAQSSSEV